MKSVRIHRTGHVSGWICSSCRAKTVNSGRKALSIRTFATAATHAPARGKLPDTPARTRFAPSPTGNLHLGSIRTALFNYLLARATKGQFLLRLEDTDAKRTVPGAEERLYKDLRWAGLEWDEGPIVGGPFGPYRQSERLPQYQKHIEVLLGSWKAYRCFCTSERLDELNRRRHKKGLSLGYDRKCLHTNVAEAEERARQGEPHVVRFISPAQWPRYTDLVYGKSGHGAEKAKKLLVDEPVYEDAILMKSDGFPTYHWANVCDDHDMHITHVVRGSEWMASTPLHIALYESLDWSPPRYAHVPLLVDQNKQKLSKRNFDSDIASFRDKGIFPEALINFAALLGWSHMQKDDVMDLPKLESLFDMKITKGNTIVSFNKLDYLQTKHARRRVLAKGPNFEQMIRDLAVAVLDKYGAERVMAFLGKRSLREVLANMLSGVESVKRYSPAAFAEECAPYFERSDWPATVYEGDLVEVTLLQPLRVAASTICLVPESSWSDAVHTSQLQALTVPPDASMDAAKWRRDMYHYLRWALVGGERGPSIGKTLEILGKDESVDRIRAANIKLQEIEVSRTKPKIEAIEFKGDSEGKRRVEKQWTAHTMQE